MRSGSPPADIIDNGTAGGAIEVEVVGGWLVGAKDHSPSAFDGVGMV
jgi:hypothetical protein